MPILINVSAFFFNLFWVKIFFRKEAYQLWKTLAIYTI